MPIAPRCDYCKKELKAFGALLFSPPRGQIVKKWHACKSCYLKIKPKKPS